MMTGMNFAGPVPTEFSSVCGVCDCNLWFIVGWLIGMICGVLVVIVLEEADRRKKMRQ